MKLPSFPYFQKIFGCIFFMLFCAPAVVFCQKKYTVNFLFQGKDTINQLQQLALKTEFEAKEAAQNYISKLPSTLLEKGFPTASVDSVFYDSTKATVWLYAGKKYKWAIIRTDSVDQNALESSGWNENEFKNKPINFERLRSQQQKLLGYFENNGYPFAAVSLKDVEIMNDQITAQLSVVKGPLYHIDSIRVYGNVKIRNSFLQHYLGIYNGSIYNNQKLQQISKLIHDLPFLQEQQGWDITMLGTGATLNLYLQPKRSSQINVLVGFVPGNTITGKARVTADVHLDLKNSLGTGENILFNWQQLQPQSPQLNLGFTKPYILNSSFGTDLSFSLVKRDSSYLQLNALAGLQYLLSSNTIFRVFYENETSILLSGGIDTSRIIYTKTLPSVIDVSSGNLGFGYQFINTNYRLNPIRGNEVDITASGGIKKTSKNNEIVNLKDPSNPGFDFNSLYDSVKRKTYRFKIIASGAHYFRLTKMSTFKTALHIGLLQSPQYFQNELFRIGGYKLLRGFDEESIYANQYGVLTAEYRYLLGTNSYFFGFSDLGLTNTKYNNFHYSNSFISGGLGIEFETKFGLLNLSYAIGKRNDETFNLRSASKIHFGYINYF